MPNNYYERLSEMNPGELADGLAIEQEFDAIGRGFSKLPEPHRDGQGFEGPTRVGDPVGQTDAVNLGTLEKLNLPIYRKKITTEDWNTITDAGIYDVVNASGANKAPGYPYGVLKIYKFNGVVTQEYSPDQTVQGIFFKRVCVNVNNSSWGVWDGALPNSQVSAYGKTLIDDPDASSARATLGLGDASTRMVGFGQHQLIEAAGSVAYVSSLDNFTENNLFGATQANWWNGGLVVPSVAINVPFSASWSAQLIVTSDSNLWVRRFGNSELGYSYMALTTKNSVKDANGFWKGASPVMRLHGDADDSLAYLYRDEGWLKSGCSVVNGEAVGANAVRLGVGHYRVTGCYGFAREGWYIETPNDANGNKLLFVRYLQHEDGTIEIWTSTPDYSSGRCTEGKPIDIPYGRWIDLRLCMDDRDIGPNFS